MHSSITNKNINSMRKLFLLFALAVGLLTSASTAMAQTVNMSRYITLTVTNGATIKLDFRAAAAGTPVRIVSGSNTQDITVGTGWLGRASYTAGSTTMTIYGDIISFDCNVNEANLTAIDPSYNTQLERLSCSFNSLTSLDVSKNTQLTGLFCSSNYLTSLDVSKNTQLKSLGCDYNNLTSLDVSKNTQLEELYCYSNSLSTLDVSKNTQLTNLWCGYNNLTSLDVSKNTRLNELYCYSNQLTSLDVSKNTQLTNLYCWGNKFTTAALDAIYCALPARSASDGAMIFPLDESSSVAEQNMVASTNAANATAKNWKVLKFKEDGNHTDIATTGSYVCSGGGGTTTYDLKIAGVRVTSANCSDLSVIDSVSGTVKYDPSTKTLTLQNATIQTNAYSAIVSNIDGLTIKVIGTNNLTSTMAFHNTATITGGGTLNVVEIQDYSAIHVNKINLTIDGCTVNAKGKWGIAGDYPSSATLTIKNSTVTAEGTAGSITDFVSLTLDGCAITQPAGAAFDASLHAVALGGAVVKSKVVISPTGGGKPNMSRYITLTVKSGENIRLDLKAATDGTPVRIVSGSNTRNITVGSSWIGFSSYTADGTEMTVYGDIIGFDCSKNGANLTALDLSNNTQLTKLYCQGNDLRSLDISRNTHLIDLNCRDNKLSSLDVSNNTQLEELYCHNNNFTTAALDNIYCALPDRTGKTNGKILPIYNSSSANHATVLATNKANATAKNWKVLYYDGNADITTTGKHKCSATDIAEATAEQALTLYPNPVADVLYLSATARTIRVYNVYGIEVAHATDTDRVEVSHLPAGIYTVRADGTVAKMVKR